MKPRLVLAGLFCACLLSCSAKQENPANAVPAPAENNGSEISMIVFDDAGIAKVESVPTPIYKKRLAQLLPATEAAVVPAASRAGGNNPWGLRTVVVGIGMKLGFGGSVIGWSGSAGMRMAFSNQAKPSIP